MGKVTQGDAQVDVRPRIVVPLGKQRSGKTTLLRWMIERGAVRRTRPLKLMDADPHNDTLRQHYPEAESPGSTGIDDRRVSLENAIRVQRQSAREGNPYDTYWDVGGGDLLMSRLAHEIAFTSAVDRAGLDLIAYYVLTPSLSDLDYFKALDAAGFRPQRLGLICNAGAVNGDRSPAKAFEPLLSDPFVVALMEHGAIPLFMPALAADAFEAIRQSGAKTFRDALVKMDDFMHETRLGDWLDVAMEEGIGKRLDALGWFV
jgi:hypothetical protein